MTEQQLYELRKVASEYVNVDKIVEIQEINSGHINSTFLLVMPEAKYILQKINTHVFNSPFGIMHNIKEITEHIRKKVIYEGKDPNRCVLNIVKTKFDQVLAIRGDNYWRCMQYISGGSTYELVEDEAMFYEVGRAVGEFQNLLDGFHTRVLDETIRHFHDTPHRYDHFKDIVKIDRVDRCKECVDDIAFVTSREKYMDRITAKIKSKAIPKRVTHNDTKLSNVMIDDQSKKALCLIDLDTVMVGSLLYDYGDALRLGASTALEDESDLSKVSISLSLFESFTEGFLLETKNIITPEEVRSLYDGYLLMTFEVGMRFLDDYLDGDRYFRVDYPQHNLIRSRNQFKLVEEIERNEENIKMIINKLLKKLEFDEIYF